MCHLISRSLLVLVLSITLFPAIGSAGSMGAGEAEKVSPGGVNDSLSGSTPAQQQLDLKYTDIEPSGGQSAAGESEVQGKTPSPAVSKEKIQVVYDQDTEKDRGMLITLIIAFGISLALNIYLATSLIAARRGM